MREGGLLGLRPSAIPHLTPYIDVLHSHSSVIQIQKKKFGCGGWAFSSKACGKCVVSAAQTQARTPVAVPIRIRIASPGATFLMLPARPLPPSRLPLAAGASLVKLARSRIARAARARAAVHVPPRAPVFMSERMQPDKTGIQSSFSCCVPFSVPVTFTARGSIDDPVHRIVRYPAWCRGARIRRCMLNASLRPPAVGCIIHV